MCVEVAVIKLVFTVKVCSVELLELVLLSVENSCLKMGVDHCVLLEGVGDLFC